MLKAIDSVKLKVLCDNSVRVGSRGILGEHGFSAMLEHGGEKLLFDTGQSPLVIMNNLAAIKKKAEAGAEAQESLTVALSHGHFDHSGGLLGLAKSGRFKCRVHVHPDAFLRRYKKSKGRVEEISMPYSKNSLQAAAEVIESRRPVMLNQWAMLSGEVERTNPFEVPETEFFLERGGTMEKDPFLDDQSLFVHIEGKGLAIITGCAHSGIINIIDHARKATGVKEVYAIVGGFHMIDYSGGKMRRTVELLKERKLSALMPCHCTGIEAMFALRDALGASVKPCGAGMEIAL